MNRQTHHDNPAESPPEMLITHQIENFLIDRQSRRLSPKSLRFYRQQLGPFERFLSELSINEISAITPLQIRTYLISLHERGLSDSSQHAAYRAIRAWFNFLIDEGVLEDNPISRVRPPRRAKISPIIFNDEDLKALIRACNDSRDDAIVKALLDSGLRASEFVALQVGDLNLENGTVLVRQGKGGKDRIVFLSQPTCEALTAYLAERQKPKPTEAVWLSLTTNQALTDWGLRQMLRRLGERAGVSNCSPHTFRRTFATNCLHSDMDIFTLQQLMGHSDISVLRHYLVFSEDDLRRAHKKHSPVDSML